MPSLSSDHIFVFIAWVSSVPSVYSVCNITREVSQRGTTIVCKDMFPSMCISLVLRTPTHLQAFTMIQALPTILAEKWALITGNGGPTRWKGAVTNILFMPDMTNVLQTSRNPRVSTICHHPNTHQLPLSHPFHLSTLLELHQKQKVCMIGY